MLVSTLAFSILHGTRDLAVSVVNTVQDIARLSEALETLLLPHEMTDTEDARPLPAPRGEIVFERVSFAYPGSSEVLRDFNLKVEAGQRVGLAGRSGAGKSTVLTLLQRFRLASSGRILIDGHDISEMTEESLRNTIAVVPQDVMLFHRTVLENIRYGRHDSSIDEVYAAARAAGCREFIEALPQGYETPVGDRGVKLSGGQRQRLAIARAFLRNAPVLLLDEATSSLDSASEKAVQRALHRLKQGRTVIAVAHRLSTLQDFDRIVVMQDGRILQMAARRSWRRRTASTGICCSVGLLTAVAFWSSKLLDVLRKFRRPCQANFGSEKSETRSPRNGVAGRPKFRSTDWKLSSEPCMAAPAWNFFERG